MSILSTTYFIGHSNPGGETQKSRGKNQPIKSTSQDPVKESNSQPIKSLSQDPVMEGNSPLRRSCRKVTRKQRFNLKGDSSLKRSHKTETTCRDSSKKSDTPLKRTRRNLTTCRNLGEKSDTSFKRTRRNVVACKEPSVVGVPHLKRTCQELSKKKDSPLKKTQRSVAMCHDSAIESMSLFKKSRRIASTCQDSSLKSMSQLRRSRRNKTSRKESNLGSISSLKGSREKEAALKKVDGRNGNLCDKLSTSHEQEIKGVHNDMGGEIDEKATLTDQSSAIDSTIAKLSGEKDGDKLVVGDHSDTEQNGCSSGIPAINSDEDTAVPMQQDGGATYNGKDEPKRHDHTKDVSILEREKMDSDGLSPIQGVQPITCKVCDKILTKNDAQRHLQEHEEQDQLPEDPTAVLLEGLSEGEDVCKYCYRIIQSGRMRMHLKMHGREIGSTRVKCVECSKSMLARSMPQHLRRFHGTNDTTPNSSTEGMCVPDTSDQNTEIEFSDTKLGASISTGKTKVRKRGRKGSTKNVTDTLNLEDSAANESSAGCKKNQDFTETMTKCVRCKICNRVIRKGEYDRHRIIYHGADLSVLGLDPATFTKKCGVCGKFFPDMKLLRHHRKQEGHFANLPVNMTQTGNVDAELVKESTADDEEHMANDRLESLNSSDSKFDGQFENGLLKKLPLPDLSAEYSALLEEVPNPTYESYQTAYSEFREGKRKEPTRQKSVRYKCKECGKVCMRMCHFRGHVQQWHLSVKLYECLVCGKRGNNLGPMIGHVQAKHTGEKLHACNLCDDSFTLRIQLRAHLVNDHGVKMSQETRLSGKRKVVKSPVICELCGATLISKATYKQHMKNIHSGVKQRYECDKCGKSLANEKCLERHKRTVHDKIISHVCETCGQGFTNQKSYKCHIVYHHGTPPYKCDICGTRWTTQQALKVHKDRHLGNKRYKCKICGKAFVTLSAIEPHMGTHRVERPYKCALCPKSFKTKKYLRSHKEVHSDRKFPCQVCGKVFNLPNVRLVHMKRHEGNKQHKCAFCTKAFVAKSDCKRHENTVHKGMQAPNKKTTSLPQRATPTAQENSSREKGGSVVVARQPEDVGIQVDEVIGQVIYLDTRKDTSLLNNSSIEKAGSYLISKQPKDVGIKVDEAIEKVIYLNTETDNSKPGTASIQEVGSCITGISNQPKDVKTNMDEGITQVIYLNTEMDTSKAQTSSIGEAGSCVISHQPKDVGTNVDEAVEQAIYLNTETDTSRAQTSLVQEAGSCIIPKQPTAVGTNVNKALGQVIFLNTEKGNPSQENSLIEEARNSVVAWQTNEGLVLKGGEELGQVIYLDAQNNTTLRNYSPSEETEGSVVAWQQQGEVIVEGDGNVGEVVYIMAVQEVENNDVNN